MNSRAVAPMIIVAVGFVVCLFAACYIAPQYGKVGSPFVSSPQQKGTDIAETLPRVVPIPIEGRVSEKDAADHFMDLAFAEGRTRLSRFSFYDPGTQPEKYHLDNQRW